MRRAGVLALVVVLMAGVACGHPLRPAPAAAIDVTDLGSAGGVSRGFDVSYASPTGGTMTFSWTGPLSVDGTDVALHGDQRFDNAFGTTAFGDAGIEIGDGRASLMLDLATGDRPAELRRTR